MRGSRTSGRFGLSAAGAILGLLLFAVPASATFHLVKIREVRPAGTASYVVLQLLEAGEYQVGGHHLVSYNADGSVDDDFTLSSNASPSSPANATVLVGGTTYAGPTADEVSSGLDLDPEGGAVCWVEGEPPDCVAWGNFITANPAGNPDFVVGNPASPSGVTAGKALRRTIAAVCPSFLELGDDTDDSATDFSEQDPNPRNNASAVTETRCIVPETTIDSKPKSPTNSTAASFTYHALGTVDELQCRIDEEDFVNCDSQPFQVTGLEAGAHTFEVRAVTSEGAGLPATYTWTVDTDPPTTSIASQPSNPSSGSSVPFTYDSSELGSSFECSLVKSGEADSFSACPSSGKTYSGLADGFYVFKVRATDKAGNAGTTAAYSWQVFTAVNVTPPPVTVPPAPPVTIPQVPQSTTPPPARCRRGFVRRTVRGNSRCVRRGLRCRRGFQKKRVRGKQRCVRKRARCRNAARNKRNQRRGKKHNARARSAAVRRNKKRRCVRKRNGKRSHPKRDKRRKQR